MTFLSDMDINGEYIRKVINEDGDVELTIKVSNYRDKELIKELSKETPYRIKLTPIKSQRTLEQNALMWELIHEISIARGTERANDDWDIYIEALIRAGAKSEYIAVLPKAEELLRKQFRAIQYINSFEHKGNTFNQYRVFYGSSSMNKKEMTHLLETVIDMANEEDITPIMRGYE